MTDRPTEAGVIVADVEIESLPRGVTQAEAGMTFTGYVDTEKTRLISFLLPASSD